MTDVNEAGNTWPYDRDVWFTLPLRLRRLWWEGTNHSRDAPSENLMAIIDTAILTCVAKELMKESDRILVGKAKDQNAIRRLIGILKMMIGED